MTTLTLGSSFKIHVVDSQLADYLRVKAFVFDKNLHCVSTKPSVPHAEASWPVLYFWY